MAIKFSNNASTKLAQTLGSTDTTMTVVSGEGAEFPTVGNNEYFLCTLVSASGEMEIVKCTARVGDVFTVVRAQEGTVARAFSVGTVVENRLTAGSLNEVANVEQYVAEVEAAKTAAEAAQTGAAQAKTDAETAKTEAEAARDEAESAVNSITQYPPQIIVKAPTGSRPDGWAAADCDAPVLSLLTSRPPAFTASTSAGMKVVPSSQYDSNYPAWKAFSGTALNHLDCWISKTTFVSGVGDEFIEIDFGTPRSVGTLSIHPRKGASDGLLNFPRDVELICDDVVTETYTGMAPTSDDTYIEFPINTPVVCQKLRLRITRIANTATSPVAIGDIKITFSDVPDGHVGIAEGLQCAYVNQGVVSTSEVLAAPQSVDLSAAAEGTHHVYADMAEDGTFSGFGHADVAPDVGSERSGKDIMPAFTDYTLEGWGTVSASSFNNVGAEPWRAFDKFTPLADNAWTTKSGELTGWLRCVFERPRTLVGYKVANRTTVLDAAPKDWTLRIGDGDVPDTTVDTQTAQTGWGAAETRTYMLDSPVTCKSFELNLTANNGNSMYVQARELTPLFGEDLYNPATVTMYDKDDNPIRRVYLGWVEKVGGAITNVHCYSLGSSVTVPVNNGDLVSKNTTIVEALPCIFSKNANAKAQIFAEGFWGNTGWLYGNGSTGTKASLLEDSLRIYTGSTAISNSWYNSGSDFTATITTPSRVRVTVDRGY